MNSDSGSESEAGTDTDLITIDDLSRVQLRTALILEVEPHPDADRLWLLTIDGGGETRQIVAGVRGHYSADEPSWWYGISSRRRSVVLSRVECCWQCRMEM